MLTLDDKPDNRQNQPDRFNRADKTDKGKNTKLTLN